MHSTLLLTRLMQRKGVQRLSQSAFLTGRDARWLPRTRLFTSGQRLLADSEHRGDRDSEPISHYPRIRPINRNTTSDGERPTPLRLSDVLPELEEDGGAPRPHVPANRGEAWAEVKAQLRKVLIELPLQLLKIVLALGATTAVLLGGGWLALHAYAEYHAPPDKRLTSELRKILRGAYVRETLIPELYVVERYLALVLEKMEKAGDVPRDALIATQYWLAYTHERLGQLSEAAELYQTVLEEAEGEAATAAAVKPLTAYDMSRTAAVTRRLAETLMGQGRLEEAEETLRRTLTTAGLLDAAPPSGPHSPESARCLVALANILSLQRHFDDALALYAKALKLAQQSDRDANGRPGRANRPTTTTTTYWTHPTVPVSTDWRCFDAQVMGHLAEVYAVCDDRNRANEWSRKGLALSKAHTGNATCDACSSMILGNMALLQETDGALSEAQILFSRAAHYAKKADYSTAAVEYSSKARRLGDTLRVTDVSALPSTNTTNPTAPKL